MALGRPLPAMRRRTGRRGWVGAANPREWPGWRGVALALGLLFLAEPGMGRATQVGDSAPPRIPKSLEVTLRHAGIVGVVRFSPDGRHFLTAENHNLRYWDTSSRNPLFRWRLPTYNPVRRERGGVVIDAVFSPDGRWVAAGDSSGIVGIWSTSTGKPELPPLYAEWYAFSIVFSPNSDQLGVASGEKKLRLWRFGGRQATVSEVPTPIPISRVAYCPDGRAIAWGGDTYLGELSVANGRTREFVKPGTGRSGYVGSVQYSPNGQWLVAGANDGLISIFDSRTGQVRIPERLHAGKPDEHITHLKFTRDSTRLLTVAGNSACVWQCATGRPTLPPLSHPQLVTDADFSPDGRWIATASQDGTVRLWDARSGRLVLAAWKHQGAIWSLAFSPDGKRLLTGSDDRTAKLWRLPITADLERLAVQRSARPGAPQPSLPTSRRQR